MDHHHPVSSSQQCPEPQLPVLRPQCLLKMCQTPSVIPSSQHPSAAPAPRAQLLPAKEQHRDRLGCDTAAQHPQGSDHFSFRLDGKTRTEQRLSVAHPQEAWTSPAFGSLKAASPCPHSYLLMVRGAGTRHPQSLPLLGAVRSLMPWWCLQLPPRSHLSQQELCVCLLA